MTTWQTRQLAQAYKLTAYLREHGHDAYVSQGAIAVVSDCFRCTPNGAYYKSITRVILTPDQMAVDKWLLEESEEVSY